MATEAGPSPKFEGLTFWDPGSDTVSEDESFRRNGFDGAARPPPLRQASSSTSGRLGEAGLQGAETIIAAGAAGI